MTHNQRTTNQWSKSQNSLVVLRFIIFPFSKGNFPTSLPNFEFKVYSDFIYLYNTYLLVLISAGRCSPKISPKNKIQYCSQKSKGRSVSFHFTLGRKEGICQNRTLCGSCLLDCNISRRKLLSFVLAIESSRVASPVILGCTKFQTWKIAILPT